MRAATYVVLDGSGGSPTVRRPGWWKTSPRSHGQHGGRASSAMWMMVSCRGFERRRPRAGVRAACRRSWSPRCWWRGWRPQRRRPLDRRRGGRVRVGVRRARAGRPGRGSAGRAARRGNGRARVLVATTAACRCRPWSVWRCASPTRRRRCARPRSAPGSTRRGGVGGGHGWHAARDRDGPAVSALVAAIVSVGVGLAFSIVGDPTTNPRSAAGLVSAAGAVAVVLRRRRRDRAAAARRSGPSSPSAWWCGVARGDGRRASTAALAGAVPAHRASASSPSCSSCACSDCSTSATASSPRCPARLAGPQRSCGCRGHRRRPELGDAAAAVRRVAVGVGLVSILGAAGGLAWFAADATTGAHRRRCAPPWRQCWRWRALVLPVRDWLERAADRWLFGRGRQRRPADRRVRRGGRARRARPRCSSCSWPRRGVRCALRWARASQRRPDPVDRRGRLGADEQPGRGDASP